MDRRGFIKTAGVWGIGMGLATVNGSRLLATEAAQGAPNAEILGWRLGCQAYSFNQYTFFEAIDKVASLGLHYIEAYVGQKVNQERPNVVIDENLSPEVRKAIKQKLNDSGVKLVGCYCGLSNDVGQGRRAMEFARDMGIETLVAEPEENALETLDKLCNEYGVNVALHNHPNPSHYWNPETVLKACKDRSKRIGACVDTGHWMRSGIKPIDGLKKLEGRVVSFHFKDLDTFGGHDVPWGTGAGDAKGVLAEIYRQKIKAVFSIEYEYHWTTSMPEIAQCVEFFDKTAAELTAKG